jgi:hypothetical protein
MCMNVDKWIDNRRVSVCSAATRHDTSLRAVVVVKSFEPNEMR